MKKTSTYQATFMSLFFGIIPIAIYALTQLHAWDISATTARSIQGLVLSTATIILANFLFFYALRYKKIQVTAVYRYLQAVAAIVGSWLILSERPSPKFIIGAAMVFIGIYLAELHLPRHRLFHHKTQPIHSSIRS